jgi:hypothetical protein
MADLLASADQDASLNAPLTWVFGMRFPALQVFAVKQLNPFAVILCGRRANGNCQEHGENRSDDNLKVPGNHGTPHQVSPVRPSRTTPANTSGFFPAHAD